MVILLFIFLCEETQEANIFFAVLRSRVAAGNDVEEIRF
jgi:hypothetical protein